MTPVEPSLAENLVKALVGFPKYIVEWFVGLLIVTLNDLHITTLAVTGVAVGFASGSVLIGIAAFFVAYTASRTFAIIGDGVAVGARSQASATLNAGHVVAQAISEE